MKKTTDGLSATPHYTFFKDWGIPLLAYTTMHGGGEVSITHAVMEL
jgi:hypothetical protein